MGNLEEGNSHLPSKRGDAQTVLYAGNILPVGQEGVQVPRSRAGSGTSPGPGPAQDGRGRDSSSIMKSKYWDPRRSVFGNSDSTARHIIYRSVHADDSHLDEIHVQILINLRRLGHQIKPAKSWLPLLERTLIEGLHCPDTENPGI